VSAAAHAVNRCCMRCALRCCVATSCGDAGRRSPAALGAPGTADAACILFLPRFSVDDYTQCRSGASTPTCESETVPCVMWESPVHFCERACDSLHCDAGAQLVFINAVLCHAVFMRTQRDGTNIDLWDIFVRCVEHVDGMYPRVSVAHVPTTHRLTTRSVFWHTCRPRTVGGCDTHNRAPSRHNGDGSL